MEENTSPSASQITASARIKGTKHGGGYKWSNKTLNRIEKHEERIIALRTVPAILKHGKRRLQVNCFLDEGSDTTYVNEDVIETLGISTQKEEITINVANHQKIRLMTATLKIGLESVDGKVDTAIVVKTSDKICGGMRPTDWVTMKQQWNH